MWNELLDSSFLWLTVTAGLYILGSKLRDKWPKNPLCNPLLFSILAIIAILMIFNVPLKTYEASTEMFSLFITPATVALAIMLERNFEYLKKYYPAILAGIFIGVLFHTILIYGLSFFLNLEDNLVVSLLPKSITTAIAVDISSSLGGIVSLTVAIVMFTGILGALIGPWLLDVFNITDPVAQGVALGSSAHALGTARAIEMGEVQGAMAGVAIVVTGITLVFLAPMTTPITHLLF